MSRSPCSLVGSIYVSSRKTEVSQFSGRPNACRGPWPRLHLASLEPGGVLRVRFVSSGTWHSARRAGSGWLLGVLLPARCLSAAYLGPILYKATSKWLRLGRSQIREVPGIVIPWQLCHSQPVAGRIPGSCLKLARSWPHEVSQRHLEGPCPLRRLSACSTPAWLRSPRRGRSAGSFLYRAGHVWFEDLPAWGVFSVCLLRGGHAVQNSWGACGLYAGKLL